MSFMFYCCWSLEELNISNFNTNNVTDLLKAYYKYSDINNTFFVNYFKNIKDVNKLKNKIIYNYPQNEMETPKITFSKRIANINRKSAFFIILYVINFFIKIIYIFLIY